ncbi:MAG: hypothetical protein FWD94_05195, partial [Treponema sp.]|nr:hypothetical protein [Treponema sp.]
MAKKGLLVLVLAASVAGGIFAQETAGTQWWLSGELSLVGGGLRAEYMVSDKLSLSLNAYWTTLIIFNELGTNVVARYYPWAGNFYLGLGLGYSWHTSTTTITSEELKTVVPQDSALQPLGNEIGLLSNEGLGIVPEIGWRVDVGA